MSVHACVHACRHPCLYISVCLSVCLSGCLSVCLSVCRSVCLYVCMYSQRLNFFLPVYIEYSMATFPAILPISQTSFLEADIKLRVLEVEFSNLVKKYKQLTTRPQSNLELNKTCIDYNLSRIASTPVFGVSHPQKIVRGLGSRGILLSM